MYALIVLTNLENQTCIYKGRAYIEEKEKGTIFQFETEDRLYRLASYEKGMKIETRAELSVILPLFLHKQTEGKIESEYGTISIGCRLIDYQKESSRIFWTYEMIQGEERQIFSFCLEIKKG